MPTRNSAALEHCKLALRVTNDHGCWPVVQILAKFSPNNQNQPVAGCSVFGFCRRRKFFGIWGLRSRLGLPVATRPSGRDQSSFDPNGSSGCACCPSFVLFDIPFNGLEVLASLTGPSPPPHPRRGSENILCRGRGVVETPVGLSKILLQTYYFL